MARVNVRGGNHRKPGTITEDNSTSVMGLQVTLLVARIFAYLAVGATYDMAVFGKVSSLVS